MAAQAPGKRAGSRKATRPRRSGGGRLRLLGIAASVTVLVLAWAYLVYAAIDFGHTARDGEGRAWVFLVVAAIGAVACLFVGMMLVLRLGRELRTGSADAPPPKPAGGKRARR